MKKIEQETTITYNAKEPDALICSFLPKDQRKLKKLGFPPYRSSKHGNWYKIPKNCIFFRKPKHKVLSESQRNELKQRLKRPL
ncbi:MAG: hypothetical protein QXH80_00015 [Candidatus Nanoarchaeia archaeon]